MEVDRDLQVLLFRNPRAVYFTHWILELIDSLAALVTPAVLVWAREAAGLDPGIAASKLQVKPDRLLSWETGEQRPTLSQLLKLANVYKRNPAVFYVPEPPGLSLRPPLRCSASRWFAARPDANPGAMKTWLRWRASSDRAARPSSGAC